MRRSSPAGWQTERMHQLLLPPNFPLPLMDRAIAQRDTMYMDSDAHYLSVGQSALQIVEAALGGSEPRSILDLPSGFGRVTRVFRARFPHAAITASDLEPEAVTFCAARFGARAELSVRDFNRLRLGEYYDLIWVGSLITHLPPPQTRAFFSAMARHMTPRSTFVVSSHGPSIIPRLREHGYCLTPKEAAELIEEYERTGYGYRDYSGKDPNYGIALSNENYGISLISEAWLQQALSECGLKMNAYHPGVWDNHHDSVVASLPPGRARLGSLKAVRWPRQAPLFGLRRSSGKQPTEQPAPTMPPEAPDRRDKVNEVWSVSYEAKAEVQGWYWMAHPMVRERINLLISGNQWLDAYGRLGAWLAERGQAIPLGSSISLGCGFGGLERDLARRGMIREMDAYDLAEGAIVEARRLAQAEGHGWIRYHVADLEAQDFAESRYHAVFAHSSVHHVERLEELFATVRRALRSGGIFHLNEYVGPTRFQWTDAQLQLINGFLDSLPDHLRQTPNGRKAPVVRPTIEQMVAMDPTEAVRSAEIRGLLSQYFRIAEERPCGGALLHMGLAEIAQNFDMKDPEAVAHLQRFFDLEDTMMANGTIGSDFTVITAVR